MTEEERNALFEQAQRQAEEALHEKMMSNMVTAEEVVDEGDRRQLVLARDVHAQQEDRRDVRHRRDRRPKERAAGVHVKVERVDGRLEVAHLLRHDVHGVLSFAQKWKGVRGG